jgi:hypothetical protein
MMTSKIIHDGRLDINPSVNLGPRLTADILRRIHELENRYPDALTRADRGELQRLRELLRMAGGKC